MPQSTMPSFDDWELDERLRRMQARFDIGHGRARRPGKPKRSQRRAPARRVHGAHANPSPPHQPKTRADVGSSLLAWILMSLGLMFFACGGVLLGWSVFDDRPELWDMGLPVAAAGQVGMLVGLVLQLERVWQNSRYTVRKLDEVDSQLNTLERATTMLGVTHGSASQAFYAHMADDANPHLLLADLKGQLDMLAMSMSKR